MASKNTKSCLTRSKKFSFLTKTESNSFPRARCEETSDPSASLKHSLSSPSSPSYTYTSVKDLIPSVKSNGRSPLSHGGFCSVRSPEDITISNALTSSSSSSSSSFKNLLLGSDSEQAKISGEHLSRIPQQQHGWEDYTCS
ncbi:hypothetical protein IMY05_004G0148900 [Salix suchowensis]|nr:hypothetical protein IMY05_004G0148900 [Salix suchowensis]